MIHTRFTGALPELVRSGAWFPGAPLAYYNEFDPGAAAWLRELILHGHIAPGIVDERSILDVQPDDLRGFTQCHFFAGIGGWSLALRLAGWPDDRPCWTGSPPCQPFSVAGEGLSKDDPRHLAPHFIWLVRACRPGVLLGEQVASSAVFGKAAKPSRANAEIPPEWAWLDDVSDRLEAARYAVGAVDFPSAGVGAPHIRQRTYFAGLALEWMGDGHGGSGFIGMAHHASIGRFGRRADEARNEPGEVERSERLYALERMVNSLGTGLERQPGHGDRGGEPERLDTQPHGPVGAAGDAERLADEPSGGRRQECSDSGRGAAGHGAGCGDHRPAPLHGFWSDADWLGCRDGKWRPVEPGTFPLAHGLSGRVGLLRGYGNAINPRQAAVFIESVMHATT